MDSKEELEREKPTCKRCGSTVRFRWIVHALSTELFGRSICLQDFPLAKAVTGIGMSEWGGITDVLEKCLSFKNTFYHTEPNFDILSVDLRRHPVYDFIISSEVFEHVQPPIQPAFDNLARLLQPDGFVIFSVPWILEGNTTEHFPDLFNWELSTSGDGYTLVNRTRAGTVQTFDNLIFHGGPGQVLEMRLFSRDDLLQCFRQAGFEEVEISASEPSVEFGIFWNVPWSRGMIARKSRGRRPRNLAARRPPSMSSKLLASLKKLRGS